MSNPSCRSTLLAVVLLAAGGCAGRYDAARLNHYDDTDAPKAARKLVVVVDARNGYGASEQQIRDCVGRAMRDGAEAVVVPWGTPVAKGATTRRGAADAVPADDVVRIAREHGGDAACVVDVGDCGWRFLIGLLPPAWTLDNHLRYTLRVFDVESGKLVMESTRTRRNGGTLATFVPHLLPQFEQGVREDLRPWVKGEGS